MNGIRSDKESVRADLTYQRRQKSGILTACLGVLSCIMAFVAFAVELAIIVPAKDRLNKIDGIKAEWVSLPNLRSALYRRLPDSRMLLDRATSSGACVCPRRHLTGILTLPPPTGTPSRARCSCLLARLASS